jgi:hypothetical protein
MAICEYCKEHFELGDPARHPDQRFCCAQHRALWWYFEKSRPKPKLVFDRDRDDKVARYAQR